MSTVSSTELKPFVDYLANLYDDLQEISVISGIDLETLDSIENDEVEVEDREARKIIDFMLAHRRKTSDVFYSYGDPEDSPRFPNPSLAKMRDDEIRLLRREKKKKGY